MGKLSIPDKGRIFHNHIYFQGLLADYYWDILKEYNYREIVKHTNYTPRIMEFVTRKMYLVTIITNMCFVVWKTRQKYGMMSFRKNYSRKTEFF